MRRSAIVLILGCCSCYGFRELDSWKYEEGKRQYEVVERNRIMPKYGHCWTNTLDSLRTSCKEITDELQMRLALSYLNCFLMTQGRESYSCKDEDRIQRCTAVMTEADRASLATFFTHTHNICYFLYSQLWHENTENVITRLSSRSDEVAIQLEESSLLQYEIIHQQNISLNNQHSILNQAANLSSVINESTNNIYELFMVYQKTTNEQRLVINEIFDRVSRIQTTMIGEFVSFYSALMYTLATIICYLLTSTQCTSSARFPMFGIVTLNFLVEKLIYMIMKISDSNNNLTRTEEADLSDKLHQYQWICRRISSVCGFAILLLCAWLYKDIGTINNQLLMEIKTQNIELKKALEDGENKKKRKDNPEVISQPVTTIANRSVLNSSGYESGSSDTADQDDLQYHNNAHITISQQKNKEPPQRQHACNEDTDTCSESSFTTAITGGMIGKERSRLSTRSSSRSSTLQREIESLADLPSFKSLKENILHWAASGCYGTVKERQQFENGETSVNVSKSPTSQQDYSSRGVAELPKITRHYNMRQRKTPVLQNTRNRIK